MARMISIHEYDLKPGSSPSQFERAFRDAEARGLFDLPGLTAHHFVKGVKGARRNAYAAVWVYESREAWERLWGTPEQPRAPREYPEKWRIWEEELLAPILSSHPDAITFTAYEELSPGA
jgi:heme-degrading monooxygenase HmoA